jgi:hypothetical protein
MNFINAKEMAKFTLEQDAVRDDPKASSRPRFCRRDYLLDSWVQKWFSPQEFDERCVVPFPKLGKRPR